MAIDERLPSSPSTEPQPEAKKPRKLWIPVAVLAAFWTLVNIVAYGDFYDFQRFLTRMLAGLGLALFFAGWWFANRDFRWRDRFLVAGAALLACLVASQLADQTMKVFVLLLTGMPWLFTLGTAWLLLARGFSTDLKRTGLIVASILVFGSMTALRWEGIDGRQRGAFSWRWIPSSEQQFLAASQKNRPSAPAEDAAAPEPALQPGDWPVFRGDHESNVAGMRMAAWQGPPKTVWRQRVGPGWSSMIVVDGRLYTQEQRGEQEAVVCYDAASGREIWEHADKTRYIEGLIGDGPRGTPTFSQGRIYALGATGTLNCLAAGTGKELWSKEVVKEAEADVPKWGLSGSPLAVDDLVVVFAGGKAGRGVLRALKAETGEPAWSCEAGDETYCTPQLVTLEGVRQIVMHDNKSLFAVNVADGRRLWELKNPSETAVPMLQPHVTGANEMLVAWDAGVALLNVARREGEWKVEETWSSIALKPSFNDFVLHEGCIYGLDDGILVCMDLKTQRKKWKAGRYGHGQLLLLPDQGELLVLGETGDVVRVKADPAKHQELFRFPAIQGKTWNHPIIAHDKLYVRNAEEMACYGLEEEK